MNEFLGVEDVEYQIDKYFNNQDELNRPYTVQGLALALDINIATLYKWSTEGYGVKSISVEDNKRLSKSIKSAKLRVEEYNAMQLFREKGQVAGIIFNLKNNFGWKDTQEIKTTSDTRLSVTGLSKEELRELIYNESNQESNE